MYKKLCLFLLCLSMLVLVCTVSGCGMMQNIINTLNGESMTVQYRREIVTEIEVVTDASGEAVTDEEGAVVTVVIEIVIEEPVDDPSGEVRTHRTPVTDAPDEPGSEGPKETEAKTEKEEPVTEPIGWDENIKEMMRDMYDKFHSSGRLEIGGWATPASALRDGYTGTEGSYDAAYQKLADAGLTYMITLEEWSSPSWCLESLASAKKAGLKLWYNCAGQDAAYSLEKLRSMLESPDADALGAVYVKDEPSFDDIPEIAGLTDTIRTGVNEGRDEKSRIPVLANLFPTYAPTAIVTEDYRNYVKTYLAECKPDALMFDYYPYQGGGGDKLVEMCANIAVAAEEAGAAGVPLYTFIQSSGDSGALREPKLEELRADINLNLAFGSRSIAYFLTCEHYEGWAYTTMLNAAGETTGLYDKIKAVNAEASALGGLSGGYTFRNVIVKNWGGLTRAMSNAGCTLAVDTFGEVTDVTVADKRRVLIGCFDGFVAYDGFYVVNPDYSREIDVTLTLDRVDAVCVWDVDGITFCDRTDEVKLHLAPGGASFVCTVDPRSYE